MKGKYVWAAVYGLLLTAFTVYLALDTFVLERVYEEIIPEEPSAASETPQTAIPRIATENEYMDENIHILLNEYREYDTAIYVADVTLSSAEYLKTAFARHAYGKNITEPTSDIARKNDAVFAVNGDFYGVHSTRYVIRNGALYRDIARAEATDLVIYGDGSFETVSEADVPANTLLENGAVHVLSFGPVLLHDNAVQVSESDEVAQHMTSNPRTAIGIIEPLHYLFAVSDGRTSESSGLSLYQLAQFMRSLGAQTAYNLDGGGSSTMYFQGRVVNKPTTNGGIIEERKVSDIVYIAAEP